MQALRRLNHSRSKAFDRALEDSLEKLAAWYDAEDGSEAEAKAFEVWLAAPLPPTAYQ